MAREIRQPRLLFGETSFLVGVLEAGGIDLCDLVTQKLDLPGALVALAAQGVQLLTECLGAAPQRVDARRVRAPVVVEQAALPAHRHQGLLIVDVHQLGSELAQGRQWHQMPVELAPGASGGRDRAGHDELVVSGILASKRAATIPVRRSLPALDGIGEEASLDGCLLRSPPYETRIRALTEEQLECLDEEGLSCSRLAGDRRHPRAEAHEDIFDDSQAPDSEVDQHDRDQRSRPSTSAVRRRPAKRSWPKEMNRTG